MSDPGKLLSTCACDNSDKVSSVPACITSSLESTLQPGREYSSYLCLLADAMDSTVEIGRTQVSLWHTVFP